MSPNIILLQIACEFYLSGNKTAGDDVYRDYKNCQPAKPMTCTQEQRLRSGKAERQYANTMLTYDEWRNRGYQVQSGEKATWVDNLPLFKRSQVLFKL